MGHVRAHHTGDITFEVSSGSSRPYPMTVAEAIDGVLTYALEDGLDQAAPALCVLGDLIEKKAFADRVHTEWELQGIAGLLKLMGSALASTEVSYRDHVAVLKEYVKVEKSRSEGGKS